MLFLTIFPLAGFLPFLILTLLPCSSEGLILKQQELMLQVNLQSGLLYWTVCPWVLQLHTILNYFSPWLHLLIGKMFTSPPLCTSTACSCSALHNGFWAATTATSAPPRRGQAAWQKGRRKEGVRPPSEGARCKQDATPHEACLPFL